MTVTVNGLSFHVVDEGSGSPVLLLHGFPDSSALWRHQIPGARRRRAPRDRARPARVRCERPARGRRGVRDADLVGDVVGILDALGVERADVVGHDWGAGVGWALATMVPQRVQRYVALSVGHPATYFSEMRQREMSWYVLLFLFDGVAEEDLRATTGRSCAPGSGVQWTSSATSRTSPGPEP